MTPGRKPRPKLPVSGNSPTPSNAMKSKRGTMKQCTWQTTEEYEAAVSSAVVRNGGAFLLKQRPDQVFHLDAPQGARRLDLRMEPGRQLDGQPLHRLPGLVLHPILGPLRRGPDKGTVVRAG